MSAVEGTVPDKGYVCPACGYPAMDEPAIGPVFGGWSFEYCPCCEFQFGFTEGNDGHCYGEWRDEWVRDGMQWRSQYPPQPPWFDPSFQVARLWDDTPARPVSLTDEEMDTVFHYVTAAGMAEQVKSLGMGIPRRELTALIDTICRSAHSGPVSALPPGPDRGLLTDVLWKLIQVQQAFERY